MNRPLFRRVRLEPGQRQLKLLGVGLALVIAQLVGNFLTGVSPFDPLTYVSVTLGLALVALLASYLPARRAVHIDPMVALRYE